MKTLFVLILVVCTLSVVFFSRQSLRLDESQSLWQTSHSLPAMMTIVSEDVHVPLYHVMLHFWQGFFGNDAVVGRWLSLIFYLLMIPAIYVLGRQAYSREVGLFAAVLTAISPFLNWYGNEIRMYSLFALMTILNQLYFVSLFTDEVGRGSDREKQPSSSGFTMPPRRSGWFGYALTLILGMFTHYFFIFTILTQALFYLLYRHFFPRRSLRNFIIILIVAAVIFAPWMYFVFTHGSASNTQPLLAKPTSIDVFNTFSQFMFGFQNDHTNTLLVSAWPLLVLLVFLAVRNRQKVEPQTIYFFFSLFVPVVLAFAVSVEVKPIYLTRYLIVSLPALYLLMSWVLSIYPRRLSRFLKGAIVLGMVLTLGAEIANSQSPVKEDYRAASDYLTIHADPSDVIVLSAPFTVYPFEYYYHGPADMETLPIWDQYVAGPIPSYDAARLPAEVDALKDAHQKIWLLLSYDQGYELNIKNYFDTHFERLDYQTFSAGLNLYAYKLRYDNVTLSKTLRDIQTGAVQAPHPSGLPGPSNAATIPISPTATATSPYSMTTETRIPYTTTTPQIVEESSGTSSEATSSSSGVTPVPLILLNFSTSSTTSSTSPE